MSSIIKNVNSLIEIDEIVDGVESTRIRKLDFE